MSANWSRRQRAAEHVSANDTSGARRDSCTLLGGRPPVTPDGLHTCGSLGRRSDHSVQLLSQPGGPQTRSGDHRWLPGHLQAGRPHPADRRRTGGAAPGSGPARRLVAILTGDGAGTRATLARHPGIAALSSPGRSPWLGNSPVMHLMREYCSSSGRWLPRSQKTMRTSRPSSTASWRTPLLRRPELRVGSTASRPRARCRRTARRLEEVRAGGVLVNESPTFRFDQVPYGGVGRGRYHPDGAPLDGPRADGREDGRLATDLLRGAASKRCSGGGHPQGAASRARLG
jgi:hypothetical protein